VVVLVMIPLRMDLARACNSANEIVELAAGTMIPSHFCSERSQGEDTALCRRAERGQGNFFTLLGRVADNFPIFPLAV